MQRSRILFVTAIMLLSAIQPTSAEQPAEPLGPKLPDGVRALLIREMNAVLGASQEILAALVRGQDEVVAERAQAIHDSFILQQEMTQAQREALLAAVPEAFVERDRAFHEVSGQLAQAARAGDTTRQQQLFGEIVDACVACHKRYATDRFSGFDD